MATSDVKSNKNHSDSVSKRISVLQQKVRALEATLKLYEIPENAEIASRPSWRTKTQSELDGDPTFCQIAFLVDQYIGDSVFLTDFHLWLCHLDHDSGEVFYERICDGFTTWNRPNEPVQPYWLAHKDKESGNFYYENVETQKTQWEEPECFKEEQWLRHIDP